MLVKALSLALGAALSVSAMAADLKPAVVYDLGGKNDGSFLLRLLAPSASKTKPVVYRDFEIQNDAQREQALRNARRGFNPVVAIGFSHGAAVEKVAAEFPDTQFGIVDMVVDLPNVRSILFKEHEGSYLVGLLAGMASDSKKVGFVGGMDIPLIRRFESATSKVRWRQARLKFTAT